MNPTIRDLGNSAASWLKRPAAFVRAYPPEKPQIPGAAELEQDVEEIARAHPEPLRPQTFTDDLRHFATGADNLMTQLTETCDKLRMALAENALLRQRNTDLELHNLETTEYWESQYEQVNRRLSRMQRLYYSVVSRLDLIVEAVTATRETAKQEAFTDDEVQPRPPGVEVRFRHPREDDQADPAPVSADRLPVNTLNDVEAVLRGVDPSHSDKGETT